MPRAFEPGDGSESRIDSLAGDEPVGKAFCHPVVADELNICCWSESRAVHCGASVLGVAVWLTLTIGDCGATRLERSKILVTGNWPPFLSSPSNRFQVVKPSSLSGSSR